MCYAALICPPAQILHIYSRYPGAVCVCLSHHCYCFNSGGQHPRLNLAWKCIYGWALEYLKVKALMQGADNPDQFCWLDELTFVVPRSESLRG